MTITFPFVSDALMGGGCFGCGVAREAVMGVWTLQADDDEGLPVLRDFCPACSKDPEALPKAKATRAGARARVPDVGHGKDIG